MRKDSPQNYEPKKTRNPLKVGLENKIAEKTPEEKPAAGLPPAFTGPGGPAPKERFVLATRFYRKVLDTFFSSNWEDGMFMDDVRQATLRGAHPAANLLFWVVVLFFFTFLVWARFASLDEVTRGEGRVIPTGDVQTMQSLEGGIIEQILVRAGDVVEKGDILVRIDDTGFSSSLGEGETRRDALKAAIARLEAQVENKAPVWPPELVTQSPQLIAAENTLYLSRKNELQSTVSVLKQQITQRQQQVQEARTVREQARRTYEISNEELEMTIPLEARGVVSKVDVLRLQRQVNDLRGEMETARLAVPRAEAALREANQRVEEATARAQTEALKELTEKREELARLGQSLRAATDQVQRTTLRAPIRGTVKRVLVNTVGQVVTPAADIVELVPMDENLLVEARIRPRDVAFLRPEQKARVKITAYDHSIYGSLDARLVYIAADTVKDERTDEPFYAIQVQTEKNFLGTEREPLPIMPGMVATVEILTGKKTVMDYILKPFIKMRDNALSER